MVGVDLTVQQAGVVDAVTDAVQQRDANGATHFLVEAVAGSGKSHTLLAITEAVATRVPGARLLYLQFNQDGCERIRQRLAAHVQSGVVAVHTMHGFGLRSDRSRSHAPRPPGPAQTGTG